LTIPFIFAIIFVFVSEEYYYPYFTFSLREEWGRKEGVFKIESPLYLLEHSYRPSEEKAETNTEISFSLSQRININIPKLRIGFAFEGDKEESSPWAYRRDAQMWRPYVYYGEEEHFLKGRAFLFFRRETGRAIIKFYYPLAHSHAGERWPLKIRVEGPDLYLFRGTLSGGLTGLWEYSSLGDSKTDLGIFLKRRNLRIEGRKGGFSVSYTTRIRR